MAAFILGLQEHPEFESNIMTAVVDALQEKVPAAVKETAVASLANGRPDSHVVAGWMRDFLLS